MAIKKRKHSHHYYDYYKDGSSGSATLFAVKEAYKTVRTNLILRLDNKPCHTIVITSSVAKEGKSTSTINLAIALAQAKKKVLVIDGDLRRKMATAYLKHNGKVGLPGILTGTVKLEDAIIHTKHENLDFITAGLEVPNPSELLASDEMRLLLKSLEGSYDYILIDTPPITIVSDALPLIKISDGVVLVARELTLHRREFSKLISNLKLISANILGIIYIGTDTTHPYYHSKGYYNKYYRKNSYDKRYDKQPVG